MRATILPIPLLCGVSAPALAQSAATDVIQQGEVWIVQAKRNGGTETVTVDREGHVSPAVPSDTGSVGEGSGSSGSSRRSTD